MYNVWENRHFKSGKTVSGSGGIFAGAGFLPDWEKVPDSGRSRSRNPVQPYIGIRKLSIQLVIIQQYELSLSWLLIVCVEETQTFTNLIFSVYDVALLLSYLLAAHGRLS